MSVTLLLLFTVFLLTYIYSNPVFVESKVCLLITAALPPFLVAQFSQLREEQTAGRQGAKPQTCNLAPNDQPVTLEAARVKLSLKESISQSEQEP